MTNSEINRLGDQLRDARLQNLALDVVALEKFRQTYNDAARQVDTKLRNHVSRVFTQRTKSTESIVDKLIRQPNTRLSQMQDVVGLRYVVAHLYSQDHICETIKSVFPEAKVVDRRMQPKFGYRAVHLIVTEQNKKIEIQIRTELQHLWAQYSEALADRQGHELKYGGGDQRIRNFLEELAEKIRSREQELLERNITLNPQQIHDEFKAMLPTSAAL